VGKNILSYVAVAVGAIIACVLFFELVLVPHATAGLSSELRTAKSALVKSQADYRQLSETNSGLQSKLADTVRFAEQQTIKLTALSNKLAQGQQDLVGLHQTVEASGGNILDTARAIAEGFDKLFAIYFPSAK